MENRPIMLKIKEVPERFAGVTEHMIRQLVITGAIPAVKVGKKYLIAEEILCEYLLKGNNQAEQTQGKIRPLNEKLYNLKARTKNGSVETTKREKFN